MLEPASGWQAVRVEEYDRITLGNRRGLIPRLGWIAAGGTVPKLEHSCAGPGSHDHRIIGGTIVHDDDFESSSRGTSSLHRADDSRDGERFVACRDDDGEHGGSGE
jgi:hypothetical protein